MIDDIMLEEAGVASLVLPVPVAPAAPTDLAAVAKTGRVDLTWTASSRAIGYKVKRATAATGPFTTLAPNVAGTSYTDTAVSNGTTYFYRVYAFTTGNYSNDSDQVGATPLAAPTVTATSGVKRITLTWSAIAGATSYKVFVTQPSSSPLQQVPVSGTTATHLNLNSATNYSYDIVAYSANGSSDVASVSQVTLPDAPLVTATAGDSRIVLNWNSVPGSTGYKVKRGTINGGPYTPFATILTTTTFIDTGLTNGTTYYYRVYATNAGGNGPDSVQVGAIPTPAPVGLTATPGNARIVLAWNPVSGATGYKVKRSTVNGGPYTPFATTITGTSFIDVGLTNGTTYYYRVNATNALGNGPDSNQVSATPMAPVRPTPTPTIAPTPTPTVAPTPTPVPPTAPTGLTATSGNAQVVLTWSAVTGATSYKLFRSTTSGSYNYTAPVATVTTT